MSTYSETLNSTTPQNISSRVRYQKERKIMNFHVLRNVSINKKKPIPNKLKKALKIAKIAHSKIYTQHLLFFYERLRRDLQQVNRTHRDPGTGLSFMTLNHPV